MKIEYDAQADALYIQLRGEVAVDDNLDIEHIVGVEILDASKRLSPSDLSRVSVEGLPPTS